MYTRRNGSLGERATFSQTEQRDIVVDRGERNRHRRVEKQARQ